MEPRTIARTIAAGRVGFGAFLLAAPGVAAGSWVGADGASAGARTIATGVGARDLALGAGVLSALERGGARPWVLASAVADLGDLAGTLRFRRHLPALSVAALIAIAGGAAAAGFWLAAQEDW
jgi:hypothetical protein